MFLGLVLLATTSIPPSGTPIYPSQTPPVVAANKVNSTAAVNSEARGVVATGKTLEATKKSAHLILLPTKDIRVIDGDTIAIVDGDAVVIDGNRKITSNDQSFPLKLRLRYIDCPESKQPGGDEASRHLRDILATSETATVSVVAKDLYGRSLGDLMLDSIKPVTIKDTTRASTKVEDLRKSFNKLEPTPTQYATPISLVSDVAYRMVYDGYCFAYRNKGPLKYPMQEAVRLQRGPLWDGRYNGFCDDNDKVAMKSGGTRCHLRDHGNFMKFNCATDVANPWCIDPRTPPWVWRKSLKEIRDAK